MSGRTPIGCTWLAISGCLLAKAKLTDPGLGSGTFPVYSLHFESCTSMNGPSNALCTSEKAYWQIADALIFFLKDRLLPEARGDCQGLRYLQICQWGCAGGQLDICMCRRGLVQTELLHPRLL
ncbi:hypothetical protein EYF80_004879 [Liparis tanakae]|uniref:Uncharacterized protein n=1 Tax=Liparis tanakae TaxID=230148 RepID=A0A4Z2J4L3_9TELE|nr:hypothetical protein EYF80_004879 [Liparis tanakae]